MSFCMRYMNIGKNLKVILTNVKKMNTEYISIVYKNIIFQIFAFGINLFI